MRNRELDVKIDRELNLARQVTQHEAQRSPLIQHDPMGQVVCRLGDKSCAKAHASTLQRAPASRPIGGAQSLLQLQRRYGNRYVQQVVDLSRKTAYGTRAVSDVEGNVQYSHCGRVTADEGLAQAVASTSPGSDSEGVCSTVTSDQQVQRQEVAAPACNPCPNPVNPRVRVTISPILRFANLGAGNFGETVWGSANVPFISIWHRERRNCTSCGPTGGTDGWDLCARSAVIYANVPVNINAAELNQVGPGGERWYQDCDDVNDRRFITPADAAATMGTPFRLTVASTRRHELYHVGVSRRLLQARLRARNDIQAICPYARTVIDTWKSNLEGTWQTDAETFLRGNPNEANEETNARTRECT